ncbi:MAG TPA: magnesium transporter CorA family protein [Alphaproteobacteria bacterium]|nr:magnesium transporter CorA family protein [Alphaproteobacteria bacterium]
MAIALHSCGPMGNLAEADLSATELPDGIVWIDMLAPTADETAFVARTTGLNVASRDELSEIETSSRLRAEKGVLYLSMPAVFRRDGVPFTTPLGFVLSANHLITIRFEELPAFKTFKSEIGLEQNVHPSSAGAFAGLLETMVDRMADVLEHVGAELDIISHGVFRAKEMRAAAKGSRKTQEMAQLDRLRTVGRMGDLISKIRDSLLGIGRIVPFAAGRCPDWMPQEVKLELETLKQDVLSLNDYDGYLSGKVQFLLDATLGLINIEQNNIIKVLAVATVVSLVPTFIASWYGMNFKIIPEYDWELGYPYVIAITVASAVLPLVWFRWKRWF